MFVSLTLQGLFRGKKWLHFVSIRLQYMSTLPPPKPSKMFFILSTKTHQILLETIPTWSRIVCSISLSSFLLQSFHLPPSGASLNVGMAAVKVCCGLKVEGALIFIFQLSPSLLTLHIYTDGLDGSHPHPVVGLAVVATPLHSLDALDAQRLVVDGRFLELVWSAACCLCPSHLERKRGTGEDSERTKMLLLKRSSSEEQK